MEIVRTKRYLRDIKKLKASEEDIAALEAQVAASPTAGDTIPGLDGIRKIRFGIGNRGKRGGGRAVYFLLLPKDVAVMLFAYSKADQEDLSPDQKESARALIKAFTEED